VAAVGIAAATLFAAAACADPTTGPSRSTIRSTAPAATTAPGTAPGTAPASAASSPPGGTAAPGPSDLPLAAPDQGGPGMPGMAGMSGGAQSAGAQGATPGELDLTGDGLAAQSDGLRLVAAPTTLTADRPTVFRFQVRSADDRPITRFVPEQDEPMHLYLIRSDLTGFRHVHPTMAPDGTWTAHLEATPSGFYRAYVSFTTPIAGRDTPLVLSQPITVPGAAVAVPLPAPSATTAVDGYTLTLAAPQGLPAAGTSRPLTVTVTRGGRPVTDLRPYLSSFAHVSAFHERDLAFTHLHPTGTAAAGLGGPTLTFAANLPRPGAWRLFVQFQTGGSLHTAAVTLVVR
jgi:hypothetical protein